MLIRNWSVQRKLTTLVTSLVVIGFAIALTAITIQSRLLLTDEASTIAQGVARYYAQIAKTQLEHPLNEAKTLAGIFAKLKKQGMTDRKIYNDILKQVLEDNPNFLAVYTAWEPNALDGQDSAYINQTGHDQTGRFIPYFNRGNGLINLEPLKDYANMDSSGDYYFLPKKKRQPVLLDPYNYKVNGTDVLMTSMVVPIVINGEFVGIVGVDIALSTLNEIFNKVKPFGERSYIALFSNNGTFVAYPKTEMIGKHVTETKVATREEAAFFADRFKKGERAMMRFSKVDFYYFSEPFTVGQTETPWATSIVLPESEILAKVTRIQFLIIFIASLVLCSLTAILIIAIRRIIHRPLKRIMEILGNLAQHGHFKLDDRHATYFSNDEFGKLHKHIYALTDQLDRVISEVNHVMSDVAQGVFTRRIDIRATGDLELLKNNTNNSINKLQSSMDSVIEVMEALQQGDFKKRVSQQTEGHFKYAVDQAMENMEVFFNEINDVMQNMAKGQLTNNFVNTTVSGDLHQLKQNINQTIETVTNILNEMNHAVSAMAQGNLSHQLSHNYSGDFDKLTTNFNLSIKSLIQLVQRIFAVSDGMTSASRQIALGNADLASRTAVQASNLEETATSIEVLVEHVEKNAQNAQRANQLVLNSQTVAKRGGVAVEKIIGSMTDIAQGSHKIRDIISVIDSIAFQTNILALNASVEAARAGEQGRGFSVVANEVRILAQRSASAAKDIKELIQSTLAKIESGNKLASGAGETMAAIVSAVEEITMIMHDISRASTEQSESIQQIKNAIQQMSTMTQQNATLVEEVASTSGALDGQSDDLTQAISVFHFEK